MSTKKSIKKSVEPKSRVVSIHFSNQTLERLDTLAQEFGLSRSACVAYITNSFYSGYGLVRSSGFKPSKTELKNYAQ